MRKAKFHIETSIQPYKPGNENYPVPLSVLRGVLNPKPDQVKILEIPGLKNAHFIAAEDIIRIEAVRNYSRICFANGKQVVVAKVLRWFEDQLPKDIFLRVHRSHLVNKLFVQKSSGTATKTLQLFNGEIITVSRRKKSSLRQGVQPGTGNQPQAPIEYLHTEPAFFKSPVC